MPEDQNCKLLQTSKNTDNKKKKKKKRKKATASNTPPEDAEKRQTELSKLRATTTKDGEWLTGSGRRSKKHPKGSPARLTATNKTSGSVAPAQGYVSELSAQARESLRWEGVLEDPQAEEKRLELYRANRRQRYIAHREALLKETQDTLRQTFPKEDKEKKASEQQRSVSSSPHLSAD
ncbi:protein LIAT1 [Thunnus thynnus]|uniref:protein LIAT1 n=1 Tax=Thunnus thynnus TaxID=8237 RepID=UPI00352816BB